MYYYARGINQRLEKGSVILRVERERNALYRLVNILTALGFPFALLLLSTSSYTGLAPQVAVAIPMITTALGELVQPLLRSQYLVKSLDDIPNYDPSFTTSVKVCELALSLLFLVVMVRVGV